MICWKTAIKLSLIVVFIFYGISFHNFAWAETQGLAPDIGHFWFSFLASQYFKNNFSATRSAVFVLSLGVGKEIFDFLTKKEWSGPDMLFNLAGIFTGLTIKLN